MASNYRLILKDPKSTERTAIFMTIYVHNKKYKFFTGEHIEPSKWNGLKQEVKKSEFSSEINERLRAQGQALYQTVKSLEHDGIEVNKESIERRLHEILNRTSDNKSTADGSNALLTDFVAQLIQDERENKRVFEGRQFSTHTIKTHNTTLNHLRNYEEAMGVRLSFHTLDQSFYASFVHYLNAQGKALNSVGTQIKNIKAFASEARKRGIKVSADVEKFKKLAEDTDKVYLSMKELQTLYDLDLSTKKKLDRTRDVFLLGCFTGLRFADLQQLKQEHLSENRIRILTQKTKETVVIPMHPMVKGILEKYNYIPPRAISNQKFNENLKELCKLADLDHTEVISITKGGATTTSLEPKHKLVSAHTARRSFATNLYLAGLDSLSIMKMTGHRTEKAFLTYIRVTPEQNADKVAKHAFFR